MLIVNNVHIIVLQCNEAKNLYISIKKLVIMGDEMEIYVQDQNKNTNVYVCLKLDRFWIDDWFSL